MSEERFQALAKLVEVWQTSESLNEVAERMSELVIDSRLIDTGYLRNLATQLRSQGVQLKEFNKNRKCSVRHERLTSDQYQRLRIAARRALAAARSDKEKACSNAANPSTSASLVPTSTAS